MRQTVVHITSWRNKGGGTEIAKQIMHTANISSRTIYLENNKPYTKLNNITDRHTNIYIPFYNILFSAIYVRSLIKKYKHLLIHSHGKRAGIHSRFCKILFPKKVKVVHTFHGITSSSGLNRCLSLIMESILSILTSAIIANGQAELLMFRSVFKIRCKSFRINQPYNQNNIINIRRSKISRIGFAARMEKGKLQKDLIRLISFFNIKYPERKLTLVLCGDGSYKKNILSMGKKMLPGKITYLGHLKDMKTFYSQIDAYAHFSLYEGMPLSLVDAVVCGLPCISTNVDGSRDVIQQSGGGWLVPLSNTSEQLSVLEKVVIDFRKYKNRLLKVKKLGKIIFCPKQYTRFHNELYHTLLKEMQV